MPGYPSSQRFEILRFFYQGHLLFSRGPDNRFHATEEIQDARHPEAVIDLQTTLLIPDDADILEHGKMFGYGGRVGADHPGQVVDASLLARELIDYEKPGGVGHGLDYPGPGLEQSLFFLIHSQSPCFSFRLFGKIAK